MHATMLLTAATATEPSNLGEGVVLLVVGMGVVFVALALMLGLVAVLARVAKRPEPVAAASPSPAPAPTVVSEGAITPELVAVLTAAAVAATGGPVRVRRVTVLGSTQSGAWLAGGRASLMGSHRPVRRRP